MIILRVAILTFFVGAYFCSTVHAQVIFVDRSNEAKTQDGLSWDTAYSTLQAGIDAAAESIATEVWVAAGVYDEARNSLSTSGPDNTGSVVLAEGIAIYGGFVGTELSRDEREPETFLTVIDGSASRDMFPAYFVVIAADSAVIDGFTIQGGRATDPTYRYGAGIRGCGEDEFTIRNCNFRDNVAMTGGSAIRGTLNTVTIERCVFEDTEGSAINFGRELLITDCVFDGFVSGVAINSNGGVTVRRSQFRYRDVLGVAISGSAIFENCIFDGQGGTSRAAWVTGSGSSMGDTTASASFRNCVFVGNGERDGSVLYFADANTSFINCVLWGNNDETLIRVSGGSGGVSVLSNILQPGEIQGINIFVPPEGNIDADPLFVNPSASDYRLRPESPAIDAGRENFAPTEDFDGNLRPLGEGFDMGAYEFDPDAVFIDPFDATGDSQVNAGDIQDLINQVLGTTPQTTDLNADDVTNAADIQLIINKVLGII